MFIPTMILGLILRFAVSSDQVNGINVHLIGDIFLWITLGLVALTIVIFGGFAAIVATSTRSVPKRSTRRR